MYIVEPSGARGAGFEIDELEAHGRQQLEHRAQRQLPRVQRDDGQFALDQLDLIECARRSAQYAVFVSLHVELQKCRTVARDLGIVQRHDAHGLLGDNRDPRGRDAVRVEHRQERGAREIRCDIELSRCRRLPERDGDHVSEWIGRRCLAQPDERLFERLERDDRVSVPVGTQLAPVLPAVPADIEHQRDRSPCEQ